MQEQEDWGVLLKFVFYIFLSKYVTRRQVAMFKRKNEATTK